MLVTRDNFEEALSRLTSRRLVVDSETTGLQPWVRPSKPADHPVGWAVKSGDFAAYFSLAHADTANLTGEQVFRLYKKLESADLLVNHNMGFDENMARTHGGIEFPKTHDTMCAAALMNENAPRGLKEFADKYIQAGSSDAETRLNAVLREHKLKKGQMGLLPGHMVAPYAIQDVVLADALDEMAFAKLYRPSLYEELNEFSSLLCKMNRRGMPVDLEVLRARRAEAEVESERVLAKLKAIAGPDFNPNSPPRVKILLKTVDAREETLLACKDPNAALVLEYKAWNKAITTYYNVYEEETDVHGRLHGGFNPVGTVTGRITHSKPNLGAVPQWSEAQKIKDVFVAPPGWTMVEADYSQAEPRLITHYTRDPRLVEIFENGLDLHGEVAKDMGVSRRVGKTINLSIIYGIGADTLGERLGIKGDEAYKYLQTYFKRFPGVRQLMLKAERTARSVGYISLYSGRRRHFNSVTAPTHKAFSNLIQGGVGEFVRRTMVVLDKDLPEFVQLLQVHDSIIGLVRDEDVAEVVPLIQQKMEYHPWCSVRLRVDIKTGRSWGTMKEWKHA